MHYTKILGPRPIGLAAAAVMVAGLATGGAASATTTPTTVQASVANNTLTIRGTSGDDAIGVSGDAASPNLLRLDIGNDGTVDQTFDRTTFNAITVLLGDGNDLFVEPPGVFADEALTVDAGKGDDVVMTGDGNDLIYGGAGNDRIQSGAGDDVIRAGSGDDDVSGGLGHDIAFLDGGRDSFRWLPGDGSDVVDGGSGSDAMDFTGSDAAETMSLSANGSRAVFLRDVGTIRMDLSRVETVNVRAAGGADHLTVNDMSGTDVRSANFDLSAQAVPGGDAAADVVTLNGSDRADHVQVDAVGPEVDASGLYVDTRLRGSEAALDHLQVDTQGGNDRVDVSPAATALIGVATDLGTGQR